MFERVSLRGRVSPNKIPGDLLRLPADETLAQTNLDPALRNRLNDRGHTGVPTSSDLDVLR